MVCFMIIANIVRLLSYKSDSWFFVVFSEATIDLTQQSNNVIFLRNNTQNNISNYLETSLSMYTFTRDESEQS